MTNTYLYKLTIQERTSHLRSTLDYYSTTKRELSATKSGGQELQYSRIYGQE